ncbi:MAG: exodeoxyribonuclease VII large subunit [Marinilabiliales bacterium]|nr:MAG: exodeoxyribonuclease VII large subunit [Marinilabiliales bacterium]
MNGEQVQFFTLSQLSLKIKRLMLENFRHAVWVKADMLKLNFYPRSGHAFPDLVEKQNDEVISKIRANIWADDLQRISQRFKHVTGKNLGDGISILFKAEVRYHELYGLSLRIVDIDPTYTLGEMALQKEKTVKKLKEEGLFDRNKKLVLPDFPNRLAVISIDTSRGYRDLLKILWWEGVLFRTEITLFPAVLQGEKAITTISKRIGEIAMRKEEFDAILIIRGGGDEAGMDCYDHYTLARNVALAPLPVISGIGHATNDTVTEMVSHSNKITPTDVAYFLLSKYSHQYQLLQERSARLTTFTMMYFSEEEARLQEAARKLSARSIKRFSKEYEMLAHLRSKAMELPKRKIIQEREKIKQAEHILLKKPAKNTQTGLKKLDFTLERLERAVKHNLKAAKAKQESLDQHIKLLDPENILKRGYSLSLYEGKVLRSTAGLKKGDVITTRLAKGEIESKIEKTKKK